jgi:diguanylate cyclase (GGDEF)-like protein
MSHTGAQIPEVLTSDWRVVSATAKDWLESDISDWLASHSHVSGVEVFIYHSILCQYESVLLIGKKNTDKQWGELDKDDEKIARLFVYGYVSEELLQALLKRLASSLEHLVKLYRHLLTERMFDFTSVIMYQTVEFNGRWVLANANEALTAMVGESVEALIGLQASKDLIDYVHPDDIAQLQSAYDLARATTRSLTLKYRLRNAAGQYVPVTEHVKYSDTTDVRFSVSVIWPQSWEGQESKSPDRLLQQVDSFVQDINFETGERFLVHFARRIEAGPGIKSIAILAQLDNGWWECRVIERGAQLHPLFVFKQDRYRFDKQLWNELSTFTEDQPEAVLLGDSPYFSTIPLQRDGDPIIASLILGSDELLKRDGSVMRMMELFCPRILKEIRQLRIAEAQVAQNRQLVEQKTQLTGMVYMLGQLDTANSEDEFIRKAEEHLQQIFPLSRLDWLYWASNEWFLVDIHANDHRRWFEDGRFVNYVKWDKYLEAARCTNQVQVDNSEQRVYWPVGPTEAGFLVMVLTLRGCLPGTDLLSFSQNAFSLALSGLQQRENLRFQAMHDSLTGLGNRVQLHAWMKAVLPVQKQASLLLFDLNRFKEINDSFGHQFGDKLLQRIGPRISKCLVTHEHYLARLGGDEFALFFPNCSHDQAYSQALKIYDNLAQTYIIDGLRFQVEASVGVSHFPTHGKDGHELLRCADVAMYVAKSSNDNVVVFKRELDNTTPMRIAVLSELDQALDEGQLWVAYQPIMQTETGTIAGLEALVRWKHPLYGNMSPAEFIPIAEMGEGIRKITDFVLHQTMRRLNQWREIAPNLHAAINISPQILLNHQFPMIMKEYLYDYKLPGEAIVLELTESTLLVDPKRAIEIIKVLGAMGIQMEIDDFGTGYSSLSYLKSLPISALKIDRSFITDIIRESQNETIVASTVQMAHSLGLKIIAEGVEDEATLLKMMRLDCDMIQGYYFATPIPASEVDNWLLRNM